MRFWIAAAIALMLAPTKPECQVTQGKVYVEFAEGQDLDSFESTALSATHIMKAVKVWATEHTGVQVVVKSVHFNNKALTSARVCLGEGQSTHHLTLVSHESQWVVESVGYRYGN